MLSNNSMITLTCLPLLVIFVFRERLYKMELCKAVHELRTLANRHLWRYLIDHHEARVMKRSRHVYGRNGSPRVYRLTQTTVVKFCSKTRSHEGETMQFVRDHTSVPIPEVLDLWTQADGCVAMVMTWVEGQTLKAVWPRLSAEDKLRIAGQLKQYLDELRLLPQPTDFTGCIGTCKNQPISDALLSNRPCGPFASDQEFNEFLVSRLAFMESTEEGRLELEGVKKKALASPCRQVVFTHSDIAARNILLNDQNDIIAILDWEMSGWMPEQWEYLKAMWMGQYDEDWPEFVHLFLEPYEDDLQIHNEMCKLHGAPF